MNDAQSFKMNVDSSRSEVLLLTDHTGINPKKLHDPFANK